MGIFAHIAITAKVSIQEGIDIKIVKIHTLFSISQIKGMFQTYIQHRTSSSNHLHFFFVLVSVFENRDSMNLKILILVHDHPTAK